MKNESIKRYHIYVFVILNEWDKAEEFFIIRGRELLENIDLFFGASYRDPSKPSNMPAINYGSLAPYRDNWQIFDESSGERKP